ncbi:unnamed protein product [Clonostachys solani]|uniref:Uncharacterized protein n=1 Tax=Clonostachys solani TaxID=160281 RepID=A0A9N9ZB16_9HYPO|nr:unnamed protein product [Clonostachys solani]
MSQKDKTEDRPALEEYHQQGPKQIPQREAQPPEQPPVMSDHEQLQQLQITVMQLERAFHNFVNASSPNHSHKGSLDSMISNQSSLSRPSSAISLTSPNPPDIKDAYLHNPPKTYTSSPLGRPATTSNHSANNSRTNSITSDSPTADMGPKQLDGRGKSSRLRKVLSAGSMELLGGHPDTACDDQAVKVTGQGVAHEPRNENKTPTHNISGHGIYGRRIFSKSVDNLAASSMATPASAPSMLRKVGNGMKRKSRTLSGLFRPKSAVATGFPNTAFEVELPLTDGPLESQVPEETPSLTSNTAKAKTNWSREDFYQGLETPEPPPFNMNNNYASVHIQDAGTIQKPEMAPRGILKKQSQSTAYPVEFPDTPTQVISEITSSPLSTVPNTPQTETQYEHWVNPFETTDLETLMDALEHVYDYDEPAESVQEANKHQPPFAPRPISYYL